MDFKLGETEEALREEIRQFALAEIPEDFLADALDEESRDEDWAFTMSISKKLARKGWLVMAWPKKYGGQEASYFEQMVLNMEAAYWCIPGISMGAGGTDWVGQSLILFGSEEQRQRYMPLIASGDPDGVWCTGYSEPDAGSDFANIQTRAVREGDEYVINGQKIWTSCAHRARWCWLAVRTDPNAQKKHHGISLFIVDMNSPGITVRPLLNYSGVHVLNEVFFDNVQVPANNLVGEENRGWYQLMQSLAYERHSAGAHIYGKAKLVLESLVNFVKETKYDGLLLSQNPIIQHKLAERAVELETLKMFCYEINWKMSQNVVPGYESSRNKVYSDHVAERIATTGTEILGAYSQIDQYSKFAKIRGLVQRLYLMSPGIAIAAGTAEIEKNIIGQFKLGLPKSY